MRLAKELQLFLKEYNSYESTILTPTLLELNKYLKEIKIERIKSKIELNQKN